MLPSYDPNFSGSAPFVLKPNSEHYRLVILTQPPRQAVYRRLLKPAPVVAVEPRPPENEQVDKFCVRVSVLTSSNSSTEGKQTSLEGTTTLAFAYSESSVTFKKLKFLLTSRQTNCLFRLRFTLHRWAGGAVEELPEASVVSDLIEVFSHSSYLSAGGRKGSRNGASAPISQKELTSAPPSTPSSTVPPPQEFHLSVREEKGDQILSIGDPVLRPKFSQSDIVGEWQISLVVYQKVGQRPSFLVPDIQFICLQDEQERIRGEFSENSKNPFLSGHFSGHVISAFTTSCGLPGKWKVALATCLLSGQIPPELVSSRTNHGVLIFHIRIVDETFSPFAEHSSENKSSGLPTGFSAAGPGDLFITFKDIPIVMFARKSQQTKEEQIETRQLQLQQLQQLQLRQNQQRQELLRSIDHTENTLKKKQRKIFTDQDDEEDEEEIEEQLEEVLSDENFDRKFEVVTVRKRDIEKVDDIEQEIQPKKRRIGEDNYNANSATDDSSNSDSVDSTSPRGKKNKIKISHDCLSTSPTAQTYRSITDATLIADTLDFVKAVSSFGTCSDEFSATSRTVPVVASVTATVATTPTSSPNGTLRTSGFVPYSQARSTSPLPATPTVHIPFPATPTNGKVVATDALNKLIANRPPLTVVPTIVTSPMLPAPTPISAIPLQSSAQSPPTQSKTQKSSEEYLSQFVGSLCGAPPPIPYNFVCPQSPSPLETDSVPHLENSQKGETKSPDHDSHEKRPRLEDTRDEHEYDPRQIRQLTGKENAKKNGSREISPVHKKGKNVEQNLDQCGHRDQTRREAEEDRSSVRGQERVEHTHTPLTSQLVHIVKSN